MIKSSMIPAIVLTAAAALPAAGAGRNAITTEQIAAALGNTGMKISAGQVVLLADVVATTKAPELRVESMERWGERRMKVRLDCANREECLPFFVAINLGNEDAVQPPFADMERAAPAVAGAKPDPSQFVVRSGSPATLLLEGDHMHIRIAVICLENGAPGQLIHVASRDHRQTYTARVGDATDLKGGLR